MKKLVIMFTLVAATVAVAAAQHAPELRVNLPFEFTVGSTTLPAGEYEVKQGASPQTLQIVTTDGKKSVMVIPLSANEPNPREETGLAFRVINGKRYLTSISRLYSTAIVRVKEPSERFEVAFVKAVPDAR